jgi:hypothetical protein
MAVTVGYFEGTEKSPIDRERAYAEGPFVLVYAYGWRIEVDNPSGVCPALPSMSVYKLRKKLGYPLGKFSEFEKACELCDKLNGLVKEGIVVEKDGYWNWEEK